jgi:V/A-type H+-transporting ATPase subunit I
MSFIQIIGPNSCFDQTVDVVQRAGVLQIEEVPLSEAGDELLHRVQLSPEQTQQQELYHQLVQLVDEEVFRYLPRPVTTRWQGSTEHREQYRAWSQENDTAVATAVRALHAEVRSLRRRQRNLDDDLRVLKGYEEVVKALSPAVGDLIIDSDHDVMGVLFEGNSQRARHLLDSQLNTLSQGRYEFFQAPLSKGRVAGLISLPKAGHASVRDFIQEAGISEIRGPRYLRGKPFTDILKTLQVDLARLQEQGSTLQERRQTFFEEKTAQLLALHDVCHDRHSRLAVLPKFAQTHFTFIMEGWAPRGSLTELRQTLAEVCGAGVTIQRVKPHGAAGAPPVLLQNPVLIKPFETLLALLPLPKYGTIDPTSYVAMFFPPIFGIMLADIGYGIILILIALWLWRLGQRKPLARSLALVVGSCAFFTIAFGFVFGELFGTFGHHIGLRPLLWERLEVGHPDVGKRLLAYLILAVGIGAVHILLGLILGMISARRSGHTLHLLDRGARIAGIFGLFFLVGRMVNILPPVFTSAGVVSMIIFLVLMVRAALRDPTHGLMLPLELLGTVGNILSYARIMAVGLASAVLALLANTFGGMIDNVVLAAIVVCLVHALNMVLGIVDPTIQGLRLHYVEFFSKFYEGGGRVYVPFQTLGGNHRD